MLKLVVVGTILSFALAHKHPISEEVVREIKKRASTWVPLEVEENPLANLTMEQIQGLLGTHTDD